MYTEKEIEKICATTRAKNLKKNIMNLNRFGSKK